jgi:N-acyl homoserine lactone hydrolase
LFDTGQDRASVTDDRYFPGGFTGVIYDRLAGFHIGEEETLAARFATLGYAPADVGTVILSHLHQDYMGGLPELRGAKLLVAQAEWAELSKLAPEPRGFLRSHIQLPGLTWSQIGFEPTHDPALAPFTHSMDIAGDGSLVPLPTPGHTPGPVSLLIRRRTRSPLLLVGDLTYGAELLEQRQLPGVGGRRQLVETTEKVLALKQRMPDLVILPAHDLTAAQRLLGS